RSTPFILRLLNQQKYPASQLFLLMTLGPAIALLPFVEEAKGWFTRMLQTFGRVPMFYYLLHIPLIHLSAMLVSLARSGTVIPQLVGNYPSAKPEMPEGYRWPLWLLYFVWAACIALLYPACRWYSRIKARNPNSLLRFI